MRRWDPRLRVALALAIGGAILWGMTSLDGSRRLAVAELAAVPLFVALWLLSTGLQDLLGRGEGRAAPDDEREG